MKSIRTTFHRPYTPKHHPALPLPRQTLLVVGDAKVLLQFERANGKRVKTGVGSLNLGKFLLRVFGYFYNRPMSVDPGDLANLIATRQRQIEHGQHEQILEELKKQNELLRRQSLPIEEQRRLAELDKQAEQAKLAAAQAALKREKDELWSLNFEKVLFGIIVLGLIIAFVYDEIKKGFNP